MANEAKVLRDVQDTLKTWGHPCIRVTNVTGVADVVACINGQFTCIECKDDKHGSYQLTKGQKLKLQQFENAGARCIVVDKYNMGEFSFLCSGILNHDVVTKLDWRDAL